VEQKASLAARQQLHDMETSALQHSRELTAAQNDVVSGRNELRNKDQELKAKQQTVDSLEERLRKEVIDPKMVFCSAISRTFSRLITVKSCERHTTVSWLS
jgi:DNA polymerase sigma